MTEKELNDAFDTFVLEYTGRDMAYHKRNATTGLEFARMAWLEAFRLDGAHLEAQPEPVDGQLPRRAYICKSCEGVYADAPVSTCDCLPDQNEFIEAWIVAAPTQPAPQPLSAETVRLAKVALHEMPKPSSDWHEAAKRVCTAVALNGITAPKGDA